MYTQFARHQVPTEEELCILFSLELVYHVPSQSRRECSKQEGSTNLTAPTASEHFLVPLSRQLLEVGGNALSDRTWKEKR